MTLIHPNKAKTCEPAVKAWNQKLNKSDHYKTFGANQHTLHLASGTKASASISGKLFSGPFLDQLIPDIRAGLAPDEWAVHFIDGYPAHLSSLVELGPQLLKHKILLYVYPPNLTKYVAPPDANSWHGLFKQNSRKNDFNSGGTSNRGPLVAFHAKAARKVFNRKNSQLCFQEVGLVIDKAVRHKVRDMLEAKLFIPVKGSQHLYALLQEKPEMQRRLEVGDVIDVPGEEQLSSRKKKKRNSHKKLQEKGVAVTGAVNTPERVKHMLAVSKQPKKAPTGWSASGARSAKIRHSSSQPLLTSKPTVVKKMQLMRATARRGVGSNRTARKSHPKVGKAVQKRPVAPVAKSYGDRRAPSWLMDPAWTS